MLPGNDSICVSRGDLVLKDDVVIILLKVKQNYILNKIVGSTSIIN